MRRAGIVLLAALAGCGGSAIEGTLQWEQAPVISRRSLNGSVRNTTSHAVKLDARSMRLLNDDGKKVGARIRIGLSELASGASTTLRATWKAGKPVRIDYGAGTLALPSS